ncbi:MAG: hypothetical protein SFY95_01635, partial [Planctomycetota bacterium]|nr:hypothetical protein [Planctomycetota bacterium]
MEQRMNGSERDVSLAQDLAASAGGVESVAARRGLRAWARRALRERRKGTVLLFALGVLALLAVIMLVYFSLGRADRSASVALAERSNTSEVGRDVAGYILDVVSRSTTATYVEGRTLDNRLVLRRKGFDIPWTAWSNNSVLNIPTTGNTTTMWSALNWNSVAPVWQDREGFDPAGTGLSGGSPWLASTEPTYLDFNRDLYSGNLLAGDFGAGDIQQDRNPWVAHRDWMHISNIAPTGRFVNLYELRPRLGQAANVNWTVGFDVRPRDMSRRLSLLDSVNGSVVNPTWVPDFWSPNQNPPNISTPSSANINSTDLFVHRPAFWSNRQVGAFRPTAMPTPTGNINVDPYYAPYQWADADGDGFFDSRWQELVDDRGSNGALSRVLADTRFRYFVATRIVDLSALINVNTAGDLLARASVTPDAAQRQGLNAPDFSLPTVRNEDNLLYETVGQSPTIGATPADIDLRRLLTARDVTEMTLALSATQVQDNSEYYIGIPRDQSDPNYEASDALRMRGAGLLAYESLARTVSGAAAPSFETALDGGVRENDLFRRFRGLERTTSNPDEVKAYDIQARARWFSLATGDAGLMAGEPVRPRFDAHDLQELLTRRMVNDSERLSGLETVLGGRLGVSSNANAVSVSGPRIENLSPVRENRSTTGELDRTNIDRSYKLALTDLRQRLTTLSGARPIRSAARVVTPAANPTDAQVANLRRSMERLVDADAMSNVEWRRAANAAQTPFMVQIQGFMVDKIDALRRGTDVAVDAQAALWTVAAQSGRVGRPSGRSDLPNFAIPDFVNGGFVGRFTDAQAEAYEALTAKEIADNANIFDNYRDDLRFVPPTRSILGSVYIDPRIQGFVLDTLPANGNQPNHANPYFLVNPIFRAYANMLLPFSEERDASGGTAWNRQRAAADPLRTLSYGQSATNYSQARSADGVGTSNGDQRPVRGPEFALRLAASLTVNAMDMWDNDGLGIPGSGNIDPNNPYGRAGVGPNDGVVPFPPDARESPDNLSNANRAQNQEPFASRWPLTTAYTLLIDADIRDPQRHHQLLRGSLINPASVGSEPGDIDNTGRNAWPFYRAIIDASSLNQAVDPTTNARRTPGGKVQPRLLL